MAIFFPSLTPSSRTFTPASYNVKINEFSRGVVFENLLGNIPTKAKLSLTFTNINDQQAASVLSIYVFTRGGFHAVNLPLTIFDGFELSALRDLIRDPMGLSWHFAEPPQIESVAPGVSNVRVDFVATLDPFGATEVRYDIFNGLEMYAYSTTFILQTVENTTDFSIYTPPYSFTANVLALPAEVVHGLEISEPYTGSSSVLTHPELAHDFSVTSVI